jgi:hypothetical protein
MLRRRTDRKSPASDAAVRDTSLLTVEQTKPSMVQRSERIGTGRMQSGIVCVATVTRAVVARMEVLRRRGSRRHRQSLRPKAKLKPS